MIKKILAGIFLIVMIIGCSWALVHAQFFKIHDYVHAARIAEMSRGLNDGQFPVRWSSNFGFGFGMPLFEFYAPLPFYVGAILYIIGIDLVLTMKLLWLLCSVLTAWGAYKLGSALFGKSGGLITAAALTMAPYRAVNLFVRGALSEAWGTMALPWILYGLLLVVRKARWGWLVLTLSLVALFLSHNLTTMMFVPLSLGFAGGLLVFEKHRFTTLHDWLKVIGQIIGSYALAFGVAAFYIVPAFAEKDNTKVAQIVGGYFDYNLHFLYLRQFVIPYWGYGGSGWGPNDGISFFLGYGQLLTIVLAIILIGWWLVRKKRWNNSFWLIGTTALLLLGSLAMTLMKTKFIWDAIPEFAFIQFPWRWLSPAIVFLAVLAGSITWFIRSTLVRWFVAWLLVIIMVGLNAQYFRPEVYLDDANSLYYSDAHRIQTDMSNVLNDYIPIQMPKELTPPTSVFTATPPQADAVKIEVDRSQEKLLSTNFTQNTILTFNIANFPGWKAELDGKPLSLVTNSAGTIDVSVPPGSHLVGVMFGDSPVRSISDTVSLVSALLLFALVLVLPKMRSPKVAV